MSHEPGSHEPGEPASPEPRARRSSGGATGVSRRSFLKGAGLAAGGSLAGPLEAQEEGPPRLRGTFPQALTINGVERTVEIEPRTTLLAALRDRLEPPLCGAKLVCDRGNCGACTVLIDGEPAYACMQLACDLDGARITTVEGLAENGELSAVQRAFVEEDALMCGFCTPGFVVSVSACLDRDPEASEDDVRAACAGNLCRCGTYPHVWNAAARARRELAAQREEAR